MHDLLLVPDVVLCSILVFTSAVKLIIPTVGKIISAEKLKIETKNTGQASLTVINTSIAKTNRRQHDRINRQVSRNARSADFAVKRQSNRMVARVA